MINETRFYLAIARVTGTEEKNGIGTLSEKPLHKILKYYFETDGSKHEVKILGSVADVFNGKEIFEIQTGSFFPLVKKLKKFLPEYKLTVVHPIIAEKNLIWVDKETGKTSEPKKSPKRGRYTDALPELYHLGDLFRNENLTVKLLLLSADEYKYLDGYGESKKRRATKIARLPRRLLGEYDLKTVSDVAALLPILPTVFTAKEFSKALALRGRKSYYALKVLCSLGIAEKAGKDKNAFLYRILS